MVNYNRYESDSPDDKDGKDERPSHYPSLRVPIQREEVAPPPPVPTNEQLSGVIFNRAPVIPLEVMATVITKESAEDDEDTEGDEGRPEQGTRPSAPAHPLGGHPEAPASVERTIDADDTEPDQAPPVPVDVPHAVQAPTAERRSLDAVDAALAEYAKALAERAEDTPAQQPLPAPAHPFSRLQPLAPGGGQAEQQVFATTEDAELPPYTVPAHTPLTTSTWVPERPVYNPAEPLDHEPYIPQQPLAGQPGFGSMQPGYWDAANRFTPPLAPVAEYGPAVPGVVPERPEERFGEVSYGRPLAPNAVREIFERPPVVVENARRFMGVALTAVGLEYFARKRADRRLERGIKQELQEQQLEAVKTQKEFAQQQREYSEQQARQTAELQEMRRNQERMASTRLTYERPQPIQAERPLPPIITGPELRPSPAKAELPIIAEQVQEVPKRAREVQDAWRRFVVDEHDREVATARTYGEAYHQERQQEIMRDHTSGSAGSDAAGGGAFGFGLGGTQTGHPSLPSGMTSPRLPQGTPTTTDPQHRLEDPDKDKAQLKSNFTNPWFWLMIALLAAAFLTANLL